MTIVRAFLAFDIPPKVKQTLGKLIDDFSKKETGVKWTNPENMHVTMKFFGDIEESLLLGDISGSIKSVTNKTKESVLGCSGVGVFPNWKYPKIIWAGFSGDVEPVLQLQTNLETALKDYDIKKDERAFRLHLTIGRAKDIKSTGTLMNIVNNLGPIDFGKVTIDHLTLYKSLLTKDGPVYTSLKRFDFIK